jgi:YVTN family beta-propeller protein
MQVPGCRDLRMVWRSAPWSRYAGVQTELGRAVRVVALDADAPPDDVERFVAACTAAANTSHPHLVAVYAAGTSDDGCPYAVCEDPGGGDLSARLDAGALGPDAAQAAMAGISEALTALHRAGVAHGAVHPDNVWLGSRGEAKLLAPGLATPAGGWPAASSPPATVPGDLAALGVLRVVLAGVTVGADEGDARGAADPPGQHPVGPRTDDVDPAPARRPARRSIVVTALAVAALVLGAGAVAVVAAGDGRDDDAPDVVAAADSPPTTDPPTTDPAGSTTGLVTGEPAAPGSTGTTATAPTATAPPPTAAPPTAATVPPPRPAVRRAPGIAASEDEVWVARPELDLVAHFVPDRGGSPDPEQVAVDDEPGALAYAEGSIWVAAYAAGTVTRIDAETGGIQAVVTVGNYPASIAGGHGAVWVTNAGDGTVSRIDPSTDRVVATIAVGREPFGVTASGFGMWVANSADGTLSGIDPATNTVVTTYAVGTQPVGIVAYHGALWVTDPAAGQLLRVEEAGGRVSVVAPTGVGATGIAAGPIRADSAPGGTYDAVVVVHNDLRAARVVLFGPGGQVADRTAPTDCLCTEVVLFDGRAIMPWDDPSVTELSWGAFAFSAR